MRSVVGSAQHYAWGDPEAIPRLLGVEPDGRPWAEWWLGTHPAGPAHLDDGSLLSSVTGDLPYLVKLLAAARPLSLQTHPDSLTAAAGFAREDAQGILLDDPRRTYRDPFAKPELIVALTPFEALCGFRPVEATVEMLRTWGIHDLADSLQTNGLAATVTALYRRTLPHAPVVEACKGRGEPEARLVGDLATKHPDDPSVAVTLLLHHVVLTPGEALYLAPGNLHAYVRGVGVEVMGASDNVLRGGMTVKHVDVDELLRVVRCEPVGDPRTTSTTTSSGTTTVTRYDTPDAPFTVRRHDVVDSATISSVGDELVLCTAGGNGVLTAGRCVVLAAGESIEVAGPATLWQVAPSRPVTA